MIRPLQLALLSLAMTGVCAGQSLWLMNNGCVYNSVDGSVTCQGHRIGPKDASQTVTITPEQEVRDLTIALEGGPDPVWWHFTPTPLPAADLGICLNYRWKRWLGAQEWRRCRKGERK